MLNRCVLGLPLALALFGCTVTAPKTDASPLPAIKTSASNLVPTCITAPKLMAFLRERNAALDPRFATVAHHYEQHGKALGVRWDVAFFQMVIETNWLRFHQPNGRPGLVSPVQNNFAGLGATGRGQNGESFPDVSTGVLAHLQHVLVYAGETIEQPVATRTRLVQTWGEIPAWSRSIRRPVTFTDLTRKWSPYDRGYSDDIVAIAERFEAAYCDSRYAEGAPPIRAFAADPIETGAARLSVWRKLLF